MYVTVRIDVYVTVRIVVRKGDPTIKDAALIAAAQRVEHYEIAAYGTARSFALRLGRKEAANLLQQTLEEEKAADQKLTQIAESSINVQAAGQATATAGARY